MVELVKPDDQWPQIRSIWKQYNCIVKKERVTLNSVMLELGSHASLHNATDEIDILLVGMLHVT